MKPMFKSKLLVYFSTISRKNPQDIYFYKAVECESISKSYLFKTDFQMYSRSKEENVTTSVRTLMPQRWLKNSNDCFKGGTHLPLLPLLQTSLIALFSPALFTFYPLIRLASCPFLPLSSSCPQQASHSHVACPTHSNAHQVKSCLNPWAGEITPIPCQTTNP
jgi:hypothetical protein